MDLTGDARHYLNTASVLWASSKEKFQSQFEKLEMAVWQSTSA